MYNYYMGWRKELPDIRDYDVETPGISELLFKIGIEGDLELPESVDLTRYCSPIEQQESLGSCTAHAGVGLLEYFENRAFGKYLDASRLFLYKTTRNLMGEIGDSGAELRSTMGAMAIFGVPPEKYWPYDIKKFDLEPSAFCYSFATKFDALKYYRLDPPGIAPEDLLIAIKKNLVAGLPAMFGFVVYSSYTQAIGDGKIPFPCEKETTIGGHAVAVMGYNDRLVIENSHCGIKTTGAILIRNSWGKEWGRDGWGWLPYEYILRGLADDFWTIISMDWIDTEQFGF